MRYSNSQIETTAAVLYGMGAFVPVLWSLLSNSPYAPMTLCFTIPMFFIGFVLFVILDWGLKRLLYKPSPLAPLSILIVLIVPFMPALFPQLYYDDWMFSFVVSGGMLIWSLFVVGLQYWQNPQEKEEKPKHS